MAMINQTDAAAKRGIITELGVGALLLPAEVNAALEANERAKYLLTLLQEARAHSDNPSLAAPTLADERLAAGITDHVLDGVVAASRRTPDGTYLIPEAGRVYQRLLAEVVAMLEPLRNTSAEGTALADRLSAITAAASAEIATDRISGSYLNEIAAAERDHGDSLHLVIMDAHRALNRLQASIATETIDGAAVYGLDAGDRPLVRAFMIGLHRTASLRFDHPGLGTTATRSGHGLIVQNDIGLTQAHVLVIAVEHLVVTVTYTDVHRERLAFFQRMLERFPTTWSDIRTRTGGVATGAGAYQLTTGTFAAADSDTLAEYLTLLGSRLVFLIDWNRARKRLTGLVGKRDAIALLDWAAEENLGHMAFLLMGGERLVYDAVELAAPVRVRYGEPLVELLGHAAVLDVLRFALRACSVAQLAGRSNELVRDELRVELMKHMQLAHQTLLDAATDHASLVVEAAEALRDAIQCATLARGEGFAERAAIRAVRWEHAADDLVNRVRLTAQRISGAGRSVEMLVEADDAIDELEEALSLLSVIGGADDRSPLDALRELAGITVRSAREHMRAMESARMLTVETADADLQDLLEAVDRVVAAEHDADAARRDTRRTSFSTAGEFRVLQVAGEIADGLERATDALMRSGMILRESVLTRVSGR
jgi:uncharacterized protein Yka (UPF0111/DUF47 family)